MVMSALKKGIFSGTVGSDDLVSEIFTRPQDVREKEESGDESKRHKFEVSMLPSRNAQQTNWGYTLAKAGDKHRLMVNQGDRYYQWDVPKETGDMLSIPDFGGNELTSRRLTDIDAAAAKEFIENAKILGEGRLQVHKSGPSRLYATIQDGKVNPTFDLSHGKNNEWKIVARPRPKKVDPATTLASEALGIKTASLKRGFLSGLFGPKYSGTTGDVPPGVEKGTPLHNKVLIQDLENQLGEVGPFYRETPVNSLGMDDLDEVELSMLLEENGVDVDTHLPSGWGSTESKMTLGDLDDILKGKIVGKTAASNHPDVTGMDKLLYPIYTPPGGNHLVSGALATGIGSALGLGYHGVREFLAKRDAEAQGRQYRPTGSALQRGLLGGLAGLGVGAGTNILLHSTNPDEIKPIPGQTGSDPFPDAPPTPSSAEVAARPFNSKQENIDLGIIKPDKKEASFGFESITDKITAGGDSMDLVSEALLQKMVFGEQALSWGDKRRLMDEIRAQSMENGPGGITVSDVAGPGVGGLIGYMAAKRNGAGPITTGVVTGIGMLAGRMITKRHPRDMGNPRNGTPGSKIYF